MKAHQRVIREQMADHHIVGLFPDSPTTATLHTAVIKQIDFKTAATIILVYEWIGTMPLPKACRYLYGIYFDGYLGGVAVYVEPSTRQFNRTFPRQVVQLNRGACAAWTPPNTASYFLAKTVTALRREGIRCILAYCTPEAGELGIIYQALGWHYTGQTTPSRSYYLDSHWISERTLADKLAWAKHRNSRWMQCFKSLPMREMHGKYRYCCILGSHRQRREFLTVHPFHSLPYPKRAEQVSRDDTAPQEQGEGQFLGSALNIAGSTP